ncbi:hypothetical protein LSH36_39g12005 [Paralvinella palmiformis]|uniref:EF-hand domain-containing protein n=1 Tax=Paralvinella palmiformis TaxID=53620 RepID=A0AAD9NFA7_9ANNE|nr:hypothetical protein LSH36_39g12005 [Paralvinella palmiformis]
MIDYMTEYIYGFLYKDANGRISSSELHDVLRRLGDQDVSDEQIDDLIREIDLDGDGLVDYEEFVKVMVAK